MKILNNFVLFLLVAASSLKANDLPSPCITYTFSGGRFGDNLIAYIHAKWISYKYDLPMIYRPFYFSDQLMLDQLESFQEGLEYKLFSRHPNSFTVKQGVLLEDLNWHIKNKDRDLYIIEFFPESSPAAWEKYLSLGGPAAPFFVDWSDPEFRQILQKMIAPKQPLCLPNPPLGKISVAIHLRLGGGFDNVDTERLSWPLKFLPLEFYVMALQETYHYFYGQPLYVRLFSDDKDIAALLHFFRKTFKSLDIEFHGREHGNVFYENVLEDFFALSKYDVGIHGESHYALAASAIANYQLEILPEFFHWEGNRLVIDSLKMITNKKENL